MPRIKIGDLKDQTGTSGPHPLLYCDQCGAEFSANKSDYFMSSDSDVIKHCGKNMRLVVKRVVYEDVKP